MSIRIFLATLAALCLAACNFSGLQHDSEAVFDDPAAYETSDRVIGFVRQRDFDAFYDTWVAEAEGNPQLQSTMLQVFEALPGDGELKIERFYSELRQGEGEYQGIPVYMTVYDVEGNGEHAQLTIAVAPEDGVCCATSFTSLIPSERQPSQFNAFTFEGKSWVHYLMFGLLVTVPLFMLVTAVICFFEKRVQRRWLWIPFILFGLWGVTFNWTTGVIQPELFRIEQGRMVFQFLSLHFLGAGFATHGYFQPWILTIGSPVGAIAYYFRRRVSSKPGASKQPYETAV